MPWSTPGAPRAMAAPPSASTPTIRLSVASANRADRSSSVRRPGRLPYFEPVSTYPTPPPSLPPTFGQSLKAQQIADLVAFLDQGH